MKNNRMLTIVLIAVLCGVLVVVVLNLLGYDNSAVIGGGVAGGVAGAIGSSSRFRKKKQD